MRLPLSDILACPSLAAALEAACHRHGDSDALVTASESWTYQQLAEKAQAVASGLRAAVVCSGQESIVAVVLDRSLEFVATVAGVAAAGMTYLPLDPAVPDAYLERVFAEAQPALVVTSADRAGRLSARTAARVVTYSDLASRDTTHTATATATVTGIVAASDDPAYVIYTSGSTGVPKGVVVPQAALLNSTAARVDQYGAAGRVLLLHSPAFDLTTGVLFWTLLTGGSLIIDPAGLNDVAATVDLVHRHRVTHLIYPASLYGVFLDRVAHCPPTDLTAVGIGSERWNPAVIDRHARLLPDTSLVNEFGPTEACVCSSYGLVYDASTSRHTAMHIGRPVRNTGYLLLGSDGRPTTGHGELVITGANVALGYLNRPELTAQRFFTTATGERAYRTGDLVRQDPSGDYVFLERADRQVQVGGHRVEPGHVESVLADHPRLNQAYVTGRAVGVEGALESLVAYLVPYAEADARQDNGAALIADCDAYLRDRVPAYLVPSTYVVIHDLPRTRAGKIDQQRLPEPHHRSAELAAARKLEADTVEQQLAAAMARILDVADVPVTQALPALGATSLAFIRLAAVIAADHGVDIPVSALFTASTIAQVAALVRGGRPSGYLRIQPGSSPTNAGPDGVPGYPLSGQQEQIWTLIHLAPDAIAYNTQFSLRMHGPVDATALQQALTHIVARHEILRTTFHEGTNGSVQVVHPPWRAQVEVVDLTDLEDTARDAALAERMRTAVADPFDVAVLPLVRWHLFRLGAEEWRLLQVEHHFAHDGWSAQLFLVELRDAYDAITAGHRPSLPPLPVQYRDFAAWFHAWRHTSQYTDQVTYWRGRLADCPADGTTFATDRPRPPSRSFRGGRLSTHIPAEVIEALDDLAARHEVSRFAVFLAAFVLQVWQHTGERDIVVGSALVNRRQPGTDRLLGMFVNALPLRVSVDPNASLAELLTATMTVVLGAQDHQDLPLLDLLQHLDRPRDPGRNPLFNLMFAFHDTPRPQLRMGPVRAELVIEHNATAKGDINVVCVPDPRHPDDGDCGGMTILWEYDTDLFDPDTAQHLLAGFERILTQLPETATTPVRDLDLLGPAETARILALSTGPTDQMPFDTLHAGFAAAAAARPDSIAVEQAGFACTYRQLDQHARTIQHRLHQAGVRPGAVVAITCPVGVDLIATILATSRAGAVYLCIDSAQPAARTAAMVKEADPQAIVTTRAATRSAGALLPGLPDSVPVVYADDPVPDTALTALPTNPVLSPRAGAYLVYTSGSTGLPKAVLTSHGNACAALHARSQYLAAAGTERDLPVRTLITLPVIFDVAPHMMLWTLWSGGTIVLPGPADHIQDADHFRGLVERHGVTHVNFTASFYRRLVATLPLGWESTLRVVALGGEPCHRDDVREHALRIPGAALDHEYGPTEATVWSSAKRLHPPTPETETRVSVGAPISNYNMVVLSPDGHLLPAGATGELYIGGAGLATGYHRRPELTAERFLVPTTGPLASRRLYRTGDRARMRDGNFEVLGRLDDQVKIRGFRVELGEVTACLLAHPDVSDATVLLQDTADTQRLIAYVTSPDDHAHLPNRLRTWAGEQLPTYMVPAEFVLIETLPRTATGKIQTSLLPEPPTQPHCGSSSEPDTDRQRLLLQVWRQTLGQPNIGVDDDFFACGGDSLQAIHAAARTQALGVDISVADLLTAPTVRQLDHLVDSRPAKDIADVTARRPGGTVLPLNPIQHWFFEQRFVDPDHFHQARLFTLADDCDLATLHEALTWVIRRHDAFRTRFTHSADTAAAVLDDAPAADLLIQHTLPDNDQPQAHRLDAALRDLHRRITIAGNRLATFALVNDPQTTNTWLYLIAHHLIVDVVSWRILIDDIERAYRTLRAGHALPHGTAPGMPSHTPPQPGHDTYWERLARAPKPTLLGAAPSGPATQVEHRIRVARRLSIRASEYLQHEVRRLHDISAQAILLAALHRALTPHFDSPDLYVWLEGHGRTPGSAEPVENVVGWLTSLYPALFTNITAGRIRLVDAATTIDRQLESIPDGGTGFGQARYLHPNSPLGQQLSALEPPLITVNYISGIHLPTTGHVLRVAAAPEMPTIAASTVLPTPIDLTVAATDHGDLICSFSVDPTYLSTDSAQQVADQLCDELETAARIVPLTPELTGPTPPTLFVVHPVNGRVDDYTPLVRGLGHGVTCYGLPHDYATETTTIETLGRKLLTRIRAAKPTGAVSLAGWCMGAPLVHEIARQANAEGDGDRITHVILLDPPTTQPPLNPTDVLIGHLQAESPHQTRSAVTAAIATTKHLPIPEQAVALSGLLGPNGPTVPDHRLRSRIAMRLHFHAAMDAWQPTEKVPNLNVFLPHVATPGNESTSETCHALATDITITTIPGDHRTMLDAPELAQAIAGLVTATPRPQSSASVASTASPIT